MVAITWLALLAVRPLRLGVGDDIEGRGDEEILVP